MMHDHAHSHGHAHNHRNPIPNMHTQLSIENTAQACRLLRGYMLPFFVFVTSVWFAFAFNLFFVLLFCGCALRAWSTACLLAGDTLFTLMYWSFYQAVYTSAGYVMRSPWAHKPHYSTTQQQHIKEEWARQQAWLQEVQMAQRQYYQGLYQHYCQQQWSEARQAAVASEMEHPIEVQVPARELEQQLQQSIKQHSEAQSTVPRGLSIASAGPGVATRELSSLPPSAMVRMQEREEEEAQKNTNPFTVIEFTADGELRYCNVCALYKPDGSHHCRVCGRCTAAMDHHCHFINNCVGLGNYKFFFLLLTYASACGIVNTSLLLGTYVFLMHRATPAQTSSSTSTSPLQHIFWPPVCLGMVLYTACVLPLCVHHMFMLRRGISTLEYTSQRVVEVFLHRNQVLRHGRCSPETSSLLACLCAIGDRVLSCCTACRPTHDVATPIKDAVEAASGYDMLAPNERERQLRSRARCLLLFGSPRYRWVHLLPVLPISGRGPTFEAGVAARGGPVFNEWGGEKEEAQSQILL